MRWYPLSFVAREAGLSYVTVLRHVKDGLLEAQQGVIKPCKNHNGRIGALVVHASEMERYIEHIQFQRLHPNKRLIPSLRRNKVLELREKRYKIETIAKIMGISEQAVKMHVYAAGKAGQEIVPPPRSRPWSRI